jgi:hypothetical protein
MPSPSPSLKTAAFPWSAVFRVVTTQAENDPELRRILGGRLRSWKGEPADRLPLDATSDGPVMRFTPQPRRVSRYSPDATVGNLDVLVEYSVLTLCVDDVMNLWETVVQALTWDDDTFRAALVAAGAETGEVEFSDPAYDPRPAADPLGVFNAAGVFTLRVTREMAPGSYQ